jgi:hypothetical protein
LSIIDFTDFIGGANFSPTPKLKQIHTTEGNKPNAVPESTQQQYALSDNKEDDETTNTQIPTTSADAQCIPQTDMFKLPFYRQNPGSLQMQSTTTCS